MGLEREAAVPPGGVGPWVRKHALGLASAAVGLIGVAVASVLYFGGGDDVPRIPDARLTTPFLVAALTLALAAVVRREGAWALPIGGVGLAACAMVLGWAVVVGVIVGITAVIILLLSWVM